MRPQITDKAYLALEIDFVSDLSKSRDLLFSIQSEGLVWNHPQGVWNPSQSDGMASRVSVYFSFGLITYITP